MKITEIYKRYHINQGLQRHMLQVASVAKQVCDHTTNSIDTNHVVTTCLLHDVGNLAKVTFDAGHTDHFEPEGIEYWQAQQAEVWETISRDEYVVTNAYLDDMGVSKAVKDSVNQIGLSKIQETATKKSVEDRVILYADLRVGLHGIISAAERMKDIANRYVPSRYSLVQMDKYTEILFAMENELFATSDISPSDITDESSFQIQEELLEWEIETK